MSKKTVDEAFKEVVGVLKVVVGGEMLPIETILYTYLKLYKDLNIELKGAPPKEQDEIMELCKQRFTEIEALVAELMALFGEERSKELCKKGLEMSGSANFQYLSEHIQIERNKLSAFIRKGSRSKRSVKKIKRIKKV